MPSFKRHVFVCVNERAAENPKGCCKLRGGVEVRDELKKQLIQLGINRLVRANNAGCLDQCAAGVTVLVYPEQVWYGRVTRADVKEIVERHLVRGEFVERLMLPNQPHLGGRTRAASLAELAGPSPAPSPSSTTSRPGSEGEEPR